MTTETRQIMIDAARKLAMAILGERIAALEARIASLEATRETQLWRAAQIDNYGQAK